MLNFENIKEYYRKIDKHSLLELAKNPKGVRPELVSVLIDTLKERNIGIDYIDSIKLGTNYFLNKERESLFQKIKETECTQCKISKNVNGYSFRTITSFVLTTNEFYEKKTICKRCALIKELRSFTITLLFGWWSKRGLIWTPITLLCKLGNIFIRKSICRDIINDFIDQNTLTLRRHGTNEKELTSRIKEYNGFEQEYEY